MILDHVHDLYRKEQALEALPRVSQPQMSDICPSALSLLFPFLGKKQKKHSLKDQLGGNLVYLC